MSYKKCTANIVENWNLDLWGQRVRKVSFSLLGIIPDMWVPSSTDFVCLRVFFSLGSPNFLPPKNQLSKFQSFIFLFFSFFFSNLIAMLPTESAWWCSNYHTQQAYWRNFISKRIFSKYFTVHCKIKSKDTDSNKENTSLMYAKELL